MTSAFARSAITDRGQASGGRRSRGVLRRGARALGPQPCLGACRRCVGREYGLLRRGAGVRLRYGDASGPGALIPILNDIGFMDEVPLVLDMFLGPRLGTGFGGATTPATLRRQIRSLDAAQDRVFRRADAAGPPRQVANDRWERVARGVYGGLGIVGRMKGAPFGMSDRLIGRRGETAAAVGDRTSVGLTAAVGAKTMWRIWT